MRRIIVEQPCVALRRSDTSKYPLAARPDIEIAHLRRCLASIRAEAEKAQARAQEAEMLMQAVFSVACKGDPVLTVAMVRYAIIEGANSHRVGMVVRYREMAEEGTLCA